MAHVFRLYTSGGDQNLKDWTQTSGYGSTAINSIIDPNGATCTKEITSIPSPFARIDLVKTAFKNVVDSKDLDNQNSIYHKLVSDCFDVGEIFFNINKLKDKFEIIRWDVQNDLENLLNGSDAHRQLGETLRMYLDQDKENYNFPYLGGIYLLNYIGPDAPNMMNIVGATSPATVFFTSANDLSYVSRNITFGNDRPFDADLNPLYKRDSEYIKYWFALRQFWSTQMPNKPSFTNLFKEVDDYLNLTFSRLSQNLKNEIQQMQATVISSWKDIPVSSISDLVEVLGCNLKCQDVNKAFVSDFYITPNESLSVPERLPLVLPVDTFGNNLIYTQDRWERNTEVPISDLRPLNERTLPVDGRPYPYLTMCDFLEDTIICNDYPLNSDKFFNGGDLSSSEENGHSYLLPIKKEYFNYFTKDDLKKQLKMTRVSTNDDKVIKVELSIPIHGSNTNNTITYVRYYYETLTKNSDKRDGKILILRFAMHLFPFIRVKESKFADYRIHLVEESEDKKFSLVCLEDNLVVTPEKCIFRNETEDGDKISSEWGIISPQTFVVKKQFNALQLSIDGVSNVIVPLFTSNPGAGTVKFAIDFGTSNTHIECMWDNNQTHSFSIDQSQSLIQPLNNGYGKAVQEDVLCNLIPSEIGKNYKFPTRTVMAEKVGLNWNRDVIPMAETNIPFVYETLPLPKYNLAKTNLKWDTDTESMQRIQSYLENLFILMRSKVQALGSQLDQTQIIWFYPASMDRHRVGSISSIWNKLYKVYFRGDDISEVPMNSMEQNVFTMSESTAPYYYYRNTEKATTNVVSIDIGGGTSDILIVEEGNPKYLTSCQFAANSIFDSQSCAKNPFVNNYIENIKQVLSSNELDNLANLATGMQQDGKPASDIVMLFFSLINNSDVKSKKITNRVDYSGMLYNDRATKVLFILFYTALIYHVAKIMKAKNIDEPRHLAFSGTGSKILQILATIQNTSILEKYTKLIFEKVYGKSYSSDGLNILLNVNNPKEVTCKGALLKKDLKDEDQQSIEDMKLCMLGTSNIIFADANYKYKQVDSSVISDVVSEITDFTKLFFKLNEEFSFEKNFGAMKTAELDSLRGCFSRDIAKAVKDAIPEDKEAPVEETLFFYPIKEILSSISERLNND